MSLKIKTIFKNKNANKKIILNNYPTYNDIKIKKMGFLTPKN